MQWRDKILFGYIPLKEHILSLTLKPRHAVREPARDHAADRAEPRYGDASDDARHGASLLPVWTFGYHAGGRATKEELT